MQLETLPPDYTFADKLLEAIDRLLKMEPAIPVPAPRAQPKAAPVTQAPATIDEPPAVYCLPPNVKLIPARRLRDGYERPARFVVYVSVRGRAVDVVSFAAAPENIPSASRAADAARAARDRGLDADGVKAAARAALGRE